MSTDARWTDSMPRFYERALGPALFEPFGPVLASTVQATGAARVLELAAGTGIATAHLVRDLAGVTATDLNPAMVDWGRSRVPGADWQVADAQQLGFPDASYDAIACQFGVMFFPDRVAAFAQAARVLRPGGGLVFTTWDVVGASPFPHAMVESLRAVFGDDAPTFLERGPHGYHQPEQLRHDLVSGGLRPQSVERVVLQGRAANARTLATGFVLGTPLRFALAELGGLDELVATLGQEMTLRLGQGPLKGDLAAWIVRAVRD